MHFIPLLLIGLTTLGLTSVGRSHSETLGDVGTSVLVTTGGASGTKWVGPRMLLGPP